MPKAKTRDKSLGELMLQGAREALDHKRGELKHVPVTRSKLTVRRVDVVPPPRYRDRDVQRVREGLGVSQTVFARLLGASASTIRAWERGARQPSDMARRLLELVDRQPNVFEEDLTPIE